MRQFLAKAQLIRPSIVSNVISANGRKSHSFIRIDWLIDWLIEGKWIRDRLDFPYRENVTETSSCNSLWTVRISEQSKEMSMLFTPTYFEYKASKAILMNMIVCFYSFFEIYWTELFVCLFNLISFERWRVNASSFHFNFNLSQFYSIWRIKSNEMKYISKK